MRAAQAKAADGELGELPKWALPEDKGPMQEYSDRVVGIQQAIHLEMYFMAVTTLVMVLKVARILKAFVSTRGALLSG
eukprot:9469320-Pyramimonas_sp.AAC.2